MQQVQGYIAVSTEMFAFACSQVDSSCIRAVTDHWFHVASLFWWVALRFHAGTGSRGVGHGFGLAELVLWLSAVLGTGSVMSRHPKCFRDHCVCRA